MSASSPPPQEPQPQGRTRSLDPGILKTLFDFNFDTFITPKIVKIVYVVATALIALFTLGLVISSFRIMSEGGFTTLLGFLFLLASPVLGLIYLAFIRMSLELYYAVVRLSEDVHRGRGQI